MMTPLYQMVIKPSIGAIDVGAEVIDRGTWWLPKDTILSQDNPANADGVITSIEIWAFNDIQVLTVGTFYLVSGTTYKCRDSEAIPGTIPPGSKQTYAVSIIVKAGDLIGCYYANGRIERDWFGYGDMWEVDGDYAHPGDEAEYSHDGGAAMSLKGIGVTPAGG